MNEHELREWLKYLVDKVPAEQLDGLRWIMWQYARPDGD